MLVVARRTRALLTLPIVAAAVCVGIGAPAETGPLQSPDDEIEPPPPDPEGDIDPVRPAPHEISPLAAPVRPMRFPVWGPVSFVDTFGACRDGCARQHQGTDIFAPKLRPVIAAQDGWVTWLRTDASGTSGNGVGITDASGWRYLYLHINNDTPGTDDGRNPPAWRFVPGITSGAKVYAGQVIGYVGDSGNAESTPSHLHFEIRMPDGVNISPFPSLLAASRAAPEPRMYRYDRARGGIANDHVQLGSTGTNVVLGCDGNRSGADRPIYRDGKVFTWTVSVTDNRIAGRVGYGIPTDRGLCGDFDGDGDDSVGVYRGGMFLLRQSFTAGNAQLSIALGAPGDTPLVGDWNGDGVDTVGIRRGAQWHLSVENRTGARLVSFPFGRAGDVPLVGDWNGDGVDTVAVRRGSIVYLRNEPGGGPASAISIGRRGDGVFAANWTTSDNPGADSVNIWRRYPPR